MIETWTGRVGTLALAVVALAGCGGGGGTSGGSLFGGGGTTSEASCASPVASAAPATARPGRPFHLTGSWFHSGCADEVINGATVGSQEPLTGLTVRLEQGGARWVLARDVAATDRDGRLDLRLTLPADLRTGTATLRVTGPGLLDPGATATLSVQP